MKTRMIALLALLAGTPAHAADITIPNLPPAPSVSDADLFLKWDGTQQSGQRTQRVTGAQLGAYVAKKVPNVAFGISATTLPAGANATASVSGAFPTFAIAIGIPKGADGTGTVNPSGAITDGALAVFNGATGTSIKVGTLAGIGAAARGANGDITALSGLTTALSVAQGGTGAAAAAAARSNLGAAASGANTDITSLSGPALGVATAITATGGDTTTKVATTAFVASAIAAAPSAATPTANSAQSGAYTLQASDRGKSLQLTGTFALTGPSAPAAGFYFYVSKRDGSGVVTFTPASGQVDGRASIAIYQEGFLLWFDGSNWWSQGRPKGWVNIGQSTIAAVASVSFTAGFSDAELRDIQFVIDGVAFGTADALWLRVQKSGSYQSANYTGISTFKTNGSVAASTVASLSGISIRSSTSTATNPVYGEATLFSFATAALARVATNCMDAVPSETNTMAGQTASAAITGVQFYGAGGNNFVAGGTINQRGYRP